MSFKSALKRVVFDSFYAVVHATGLDRKWVQWNDLNGAVIVMYHSVVNRTNEDWICPDGSISEATFEKHIRFLAENRTPISLSSLVSMLEKGETPKAGTVVVTFDDAYLDTLRVAAPILKRYDVPATVFVVSDWVEQQPAPWTDLLHSAIARRRTREIRLGGESFSVETEREAQATFSHVSQQLLATTGHERDAILDKVIRRLDPDERPPRLLMNWDELAEWLALGPGFEVGAHTRTHPDVTLLSEKEIREEVAGCARELKTRLNISKPHFAYPYGRKNRRSARILRQSECRSALATEPMSRVEADTGPYGMTRFDAIRAFPELAVATSGAYPEIPMAILGRK